MFCCILDCLLFLICIEFVYLYFPVLFCLSVSVKWLAVKTASVMTYIVSSGALNSTPTNLRDAFIWLAVNWSCWVDLVIYYLYARQWVNDPVRLSSGVDESFRTPPPLVDNGLFRRGRAVFSCSLWQMRWKPSRDRLDCARLSCKILDILQMPTSQ